MAAKDVAATAETEKRLETIVPEGNAQAEDAAQKVETQTERAIGKLNEVEGRFSTGARVVVAANAVVRIEDPDDNLPYRWQLISAVDQMLAGGGCANVDDAISQANDAYAKELARYR